MGHLLTHPVAEHRGLLGHQVGLKAVTAGLVEQHAAAAGTDHHRHRAAGRGLGGQFGERPVGRGAGQGVYLVFVEQLEADGSAHALEPGLHAGVAHRHTRHREPGAHLVVASQQPVAVGHQDAAAAVGVAGRHLGNGRAGRSGGLVGPAQQIHLGRLGHRFGQYFDFVG